MGKGVEALGWESRQVSGGTVVRDPEERGLAASLTQREGAIRKTKSQSTIDTGGNKSYGFPSHLNRGT